jgi:acetolactate synthase I/II/III large subunit
MDVPSRPATDFILETLSKEGIDHVFLVPGGLIDPFLPALGRGSLKPIVAAQEGGAAYMSDGYARASRRFGVALGIGGPGLCNMTTAVAAAKTDGSRVLVLSGEVATAMEGLGSFQDASSETLDDAAVLKSLTRLSISVDNPENLAHMLRHALATMISTPSGPVHLSLPQDVLKANIGAACEPLDPSLYDPAMLSLPMARRAVEHLVHGCNGVRPGRIAMLAGAGVARADGARALAQVAERWSIPVATTLQAKDIFPEDHPLSLGVFGYAGTQHATEALLHSGLELLIVLGSGLNQRDSMHWTLRAQRRLDVINVNTDPREIGIHANSGLGVLGDTRAFLEFLISQGDDLPAVLEEGRSDREDWLAKVRAGPRLHNPEDRASDAVPIHPARAIAALRRALPRDGIVLVDSGAHRAFAGHYWECYQPGTYVSATNLGPMGWAIPAAIGVQCVRPQARVAVITGDGCMQMHGMEVQTAARYRLPIVYVVINNAALGNVWLRAHQLGPVPAELTRVPDHDWASFARSLGARGETVSDPAQLDSAFAQARDAGETFVIDVKCDRAVATPVEDYAAAAAGWSYQE